MIMIEQTAWYKQCLVEKEFERRIRLLGTWLMSEANLTPHGLELAIASDDFGDCCNEEYIYNWLRAAACCPSCLRGMGRQKLRKKFIYWLLDHHFYVELH